MTAITVRRTPSLEVGFYSPLSLLDEMESLARGYWDEEFFVTGDLTPRVDMHEEKDELVIRIELPGISKDDIDVSLDGDCLNVKAENKEEELSNEATTYICERCFGEYSRSIGLPFPVDADKVSATFNNGLLEIRLPKAEEAKAKHIEVKVS